MVSLRVEPTNVVDALGKPPKERDCCLDRNACCAPNEVCCLFGPSRADAPRAEATGAVDESAVVDARARLLLDWDEAKLDKIGLYRKEVLPLLDEAKDAVLRAKKRAGRPQKQDEYEAAVDYSVRDVLGFECKAPVEIQTHKVQLQRQAKPVKVLQCAVDKQFEGGRSRLHDAILRWSKATTLTVRRRCEVDVATTCIAGVSLESRDDTGMTAFVLAVKVGAVSICKILKAAGANIEAANSEHFHPLLVAAECGQTASFKYLCQLQSSRGTLGKHVEDCGHGYTVLHFAAVNNLPDILKAALEYPEYRGVVDKESCQETKTSGVEAPSTFWIEANHVHNETPLHKAVLYGHAVCAKILLDHGAQPNKCNKSHKSPLFHAVLSDDLECTKLLVEKNADYMAVYEYVVKQRNDTRRPNSALNTENASANYIVSLGKKKVNKKSPRPDARPTSEPAHLAKRPATQRRNNLRLAQSPTPPAKRAVTFAFPTRRSVSSQLP